MLATQTEFPLAVAVCAWCKPRRQEPAAQVLSHGICPRHLKKLKLEVQNSGVARSAPVPGPAARPLAPVQTNLVYFG